MRTTRLHVTLLDVTPPVTRTLDVPAGALLPEVHDLLQTAVGWKDSHLHLFIADGVQYGTPDLDGLDDRRDESGVALRSLPDRFHYLYDFGDGWEHDVEVVGPGGDRPACIDGEGAGPPEDVGGPSGYTDFREAFFDSKHPEHLHLKAWAEGWGEWNLASTDDWVRRIAGAVPAPVRLVLDLAADGVKLTPGGRLPRAFVRDVQARYPDWHPMGTPASVEEDLFPLYTLHGLLRAVGLLRPRKGVLAPTKAAGDDAEVIRRLRTWFGAERSFTSLLATDAIASLWSDGPCSPEDLADRLFGLLGDTWTTEDGERLTARMVQSALYRVRPALEALDLLVSSRDGWSAGPSALSLLPRVTVLARYSSAATTGNADA